jgi:hypothetical protein
MKKLIGSILLLVSVASAGERAAPKFTQRPTASKSGTKTTVTFAVDRETDVAVCILDARGEIVRHLVAGVLGKSPPPPLKANSLAQSIAWDGKDDTGQPAAGGPFRVQVRAGMTPTLDGFLLENQASTGAVQSLAIGPHGSVYVCSLADPYVPDLIKFENFRTGRQVCRIALPKYRYANERIPHRIAVDASAKPARIWVPTIPYTQHQLLCIEDTGAEFVSKGDPRPDEPWAEGPRDLFYDRDCHGDFKSWVKNSGEGVRFALHSTGGF